MKFIYLSVSVLASYFAFAVASPLEDGPEFGSSQPADTTLESEYDGITLNSLPILRQDAPSCWSETNQPDYPGTDPIKNGGTCRVCVIQNATGQEPTTAPSYEMWVRDDKNHMIGYMNPFTMAPTPGPFDATIHQPTSQSFQVGAAPLNVWSSLPDEGKYVAVYMVWNRPAGWDGPETMRFDTGSEQKIAPNNCTLSNTEKDTTEIFFSCQFNCGTIHSRLHTGL